MEYSLYHQAVNYAKVWILVIPEILLVLMPILELHCQWFGSSWTVFRRFPAGRDCVAENMSSYDMRDCQRVICDLKGFSLPQHSEFVCVDIITNRLQQTFSQCPNGTHCGPSGTTGPPSCPPGPHHDIIIVLSSPGPRSWYAVPSPP